VLVGADHSMAIMREETFGPAVAIIKVDSDEEAVRLMNDSEFGLSAVAMFSADSLCAEKLADALDTGTVFFNRCDDVDPAFPGAGIKGAGCDYTLSSVGFEHLTRPKSYHFGTTREQGASRL
jgi:acyl-CoA reductase-like NAD-dependent aldehyde dehydrogenase